MPGPNDPVSQRFERELADIFALQDAIADVVTDALREALQAERRPAA
jgi:TolB-like protein